MKPSSPGNPAGSSAGRPSLNKQHSSLMSRISKGITRWLASNKSASDVSSEVKANNPPATFAARSVLQNVPALTAAALEAHITVPALLIGAAARVISRQTGVTNPVLQHWRTARSAAVDEIERIAGPVLNVLPLHVPNAQGGSLIQVARRVQDALGDSAEHEQVGWAEALQFGGHTGVLSNVQVNVLWHTEHLEARPSSLLELWNVSALLLPISSFLICGCCSLARLRTLLRRTQYRGRLPSTSSTVHTSLRYVGTTTMEFIAYHNNHRPRSGSTSLLTRKPAMSTSTLRTTCYSKRPCLRTL